ncbi:SDR family oxidoreductase [Sandaracinus amylolyticus]|uniref:3-oxoacyl-[acyl-carrier protein] reductase n=1 Tax=Sandaracinus amylolyticus TaxID=927083 RepID=A0A0F6W7H0_9BACT|nr:SDR family oxidoreductase [Sandaracinus amylolyticus]AKF09462.1 3-oxoacyl-[acyl-carrier protein] reductase [Sandaracinus amylolyticus]
MAAKKVVLITGGTAGIGKHTALHLHARGHRVIATGRNEKAMAELRALGIETVALDVTSAESIRSAKDAIDRTTDGHGVDVLVNNAGYGLFGPVEMLSDADVRAQFDTNVFGLLAVTRAFVPQMRARGAGRVINVSSVGGRMVFPLGGVYHATKYAVEALSDALRMELRQFGIRVSVIEPGYIKTEFTATTMGLLRKYEAEGSPYARAMAVAGKADEAIGPLAVGPESVARAIEHAAMSRWPRARYVAPFYNALGPVMLALLPRWLTDWAFRRVAGLDAGAPSVAPRLPAQAA